MRRKVQAVLRRAGSSSRLATMNVAMAALLIAGWGVATAVGFLLEDSTRFLDLPLGAFIAGQGALLGVVIVGVRISGADRG